MKDRGFTDLFAECESFEFWRGPEPNAQLVLLWLLDHWRRGSTASASLMMRYSVLPFGDIDPQELAEPYPYPPVCEITPHDFKLASRAWRAYCAPTAQSWCSLFKWSLVALPQLDHCVRGLLEELPAPASGLGATEKRILKRVARGGVQPFDVFPRDQKPYEPFVYGYWEVGALLDGLACCERPALSGLEEGPFSLQMHDDLDRFERYKRAQLSLTEFGKAVLAGEEDFRRYNSTDRWWGGTHLTNARLWRWDRETRSLVAPR